MGQGAGVTDAIELSLDATGMGQEGSDFLVKERFPRPGEHLRVVTGDPQMKMGVIFSGGSIEHSRTRSATHQTVERFFHPISAALFERAPRGPFRGGKG